MKEPGPAHPGGLLGGGDSGTHKIDSKDLPSERRGGVFQMRGGALCQSLSARELMQHVMNYSEASLVGAKRSQGREGLTPSGEVIRPRLPDLAG